jgi:hypothetical protein
MSTVAIEKSALAKTNNIVTVRQRVKSGTGSLADVQGTEYTEYQSEFVVVLGDKPKAPAIKSIAFEEGTVRIQWEEFKRNDFQNYKIVKFVEEYGDLKESRSFIINSQQQTTFIDNTYVGGRISYKLVTNHGSDVVSPVVSFFYDYKPTVTLTKKGETFDFTFSRPPFYKNVKFYSTSFYNYQPLGSTIVTTKEVGSDLLMSIPGPISFATGMKYEIRPTADVDKIGRGDQSYASGTVLYGDKKKKYGEWYEHDIKSRFYFCYVQGTGNTGKMYKIDDTTFEAVDSAAFPGGNILYTKHASLIISANGQYHYYLTSTNLLKFDPNTLAVTSSTLRSSLNSPWGVDFNSNTTVTNNNFIFFPGDPRGAFPCVIDMSTNTTVFKADNRKDQGHLSSDGRFLVIGAKLYKYNGTTYEDYLTLPMPATYRQFINDSPSQLFIYTGSEIILYDCESKTQLFSIATRFEISGFDQSSGKVVGIDSGLQKVFDIRSRTLKPVAVADAYTVFFSGNTFFTWQYQDPYLYVLKDY